MDESCLVELKEIKEGKEFRVQNQFLHLTYKTHVDKTEYTEWFKGLFGAKIVRIAHESADESHPYEHSHVYVDFGRNFQSRNARIFDYDKIVTDDGKGKHPFIKIIKTKTHRMNVWKYFSKEDKSNIDMLSWDCGGKKGFSADDVWSHGTIQDALRDCNTPGQAMATMQIYNLRAREEIEIEEWKHAWQASLYYELVNRPTPKRIVIWVVDLGGGLGKSEFVRGCFLRMKKDVTYFTQFGGMKDAATNVETAMMKGWTGKYCLIDLPRDAQDKAIYEPIEAIKNGCLNTLKFRGDTYIWNPGWVVVFSNWYPNLLKLTDDRWDIRDYYVRSEGVDHPDRAYAEWRGEKKESTGGGA